MRFVATKSEEQQSGLMLHRSRQLLVCQRTMLSNAIRAHMAELGVIAAKGRNGTAELLKIVADEQDDRIPAAARFSLDILRANMRLSEQRSWSSRNVSMLDTARVKKAGGWRKLLVSARSSPPP
jgi:transposase